MAVGIVNKISGIFYILIGVILTVLGVIVSQLIWSFLPLIETFTGFTFPAEYFVVVVILLILPWITFIIHGIAHYMLGREID